MYKVVSMVSSACKDLGEYDLAVSACLNRHLAEGWEVEDTQATFAATATLVPVGNIPAPTRIQGGFAPAGQALQLVVNQIVYTQLVFVKE
jgi:hypothetical protein